VAVILIRSIKALFVCMDGNIHVENIPVTKREVDWIDGAHPLPTSCVYEDIDHKLPPIVLIWHGIPEPEGAGIGEKGQGAFLQEAFHFTQHKRKPLVSKRWIRLTVKGLIMFLKILFIGFLVAFCMMVLVAVIG